MSPNVWRTRTSTGGVPNLEGHEMHAPTLRRLIRTRPLQDATAVNTLYRAVIP